jgi:hypothetical protein
MDRHTSTRFCWPGLSVERETVKLDQHLLISFLPGDRGRIVSSPPVSPAFLGDNVAIYANTHLSGLSFVLAVLRRARGCRKYWA